jgi:DNA ligase (NAD+)
MDIIKKIKKGYPVAQLTEEELVEALTIATDAYHNEKPIISDDLYDQLVDFLQSIDPDHPYLSQIGAPVKGKKVKLPYWMGSMDKIKDDESYRKKLERWSNIYTGPYLLSDKLDGISALYVAGTNKLYTRGDGTYGQDISHLIPYLNIPTLPKKAVIRVELIIRNDIFIPYSHSQGGNYENARNMAAGIVNTKQTSLDKKLAKLLHFVAYEIIEPHMKPSDQFIEMKKWGLIVSPHTLLKKINNDILLDYYLERKQEASYKIDGIIVTDDKLHPRNTSGNPPYSFAYKGPTKVANIKVLDVIWNANKDGHLYPVLKLKPTRFEDVTIRNVVAHNAKYVVENGIGPGAVVKIVRSNDLLPYILEVITSVKPKMPKDAFMWDKNKVHILLEDPDKNTGVKIKRLQRFFGTLDIDFISEGTVKKMIAAGYKTIFSIIKMKKEDFLELEGVQDKMATKLYQSLQTGLKKITLLKLMVASNLFGRGFAEKKLKKILDSYPDIVSDFKIGKTKTWKQKLIDIDGLGDITVAEFLMGLPKFQEFYEKFTKHVTVPVHKKLSNTGKMKDQIVVFTGFRDKELKEKIEKAGGKVSESISSKTTLVIYQDGDTSSVKYQKAEQLGIKKIKRSQFSDL